MKIININKTPIRNYVIPHFNAPLTTHNIIVDNIAELIKKGIDNYEEEDIDNNIPLIVHNAISSFKETLLAKDLMKRFLIDEHMLKFIEAHFLETFEHD